MIIANELCFSLKNLYVSNHEKLSERNEKYYLKHKKIQNPNDSQISDLFGGVSRKRRISEPAALFFEW